MSRDAVADKIGNLVLRRPISRIWLLALMAAAGLCGVLGLSIAWLFYEGTGVWGINQPVAWGFAISNYVFWVAIAMGGTFISSALLLSPGNTGEPASIDLPRP